ncbi:hypothetical protein [Blastococcus brunescens]|uniref:Uncharacterized protein n=1 Tax=Blastococcus brunescens TaxID=1564165 RepID=A0ABZ1AVU6_9ACTN|nr:hypothetical protein [Blastococcus sp. BMG 8361]WRL62267.1 hypothetical protein U6N30_19790 [Blastococcus sp. BMG 8361]
MEESRAADARAFAEARRAADERAEAARRRTARVVTESQRVPAPQSGGAWTCKASTAQRTRVAHADLPKRRFAALRLVAALLCLGVVAINVHEAATDTPEGSIAAAALWSVFALFFSWRYLTATSHNRLLELVAHVRQ